MILFDNLLKQAGTCCRTSLPPLLRRTFRREVCLGADLCRDFVVRSVFAARRAPSPAVSVRDIEDWDSIPERHHHRVFQYVLDNGDSTSEPLGLQVTGLPREGS